MKLQRAVGQTSQILNVFAQDFSVTTGAGIANIPATTVSYTWFHNTQAAVSTGTGVSTASMGNYTSGAWTQISSSLALGWYQFGLPDGALATGDAVGIHIYVSTGAFNMAPIPIEIELVRDNPLQFTTSKVYLSYTSTSPANITQAVGQAIVTSGAGILNVSTQAIDKGGYGVTTVAANITTNANVLQAYGSAIVTSASGQFLVSTQSLVGIVVSTQSLAGIVVSTQTIDKGGYGVTTNADKTGYGLTASERALIMTVISTTAVSESYRSSSSIGNIPQLMYEVLGNITDMGNSVTTRTLNSVTSHASVGIQYQYDSTTPSSITRIA